MNNDAGKSDWYGYYESTEEDDVAGLEEVWKVFTKIENLPLPPILRILPMHHSFWNVTKHGSDVKTSLIQKFKNDIPNNNLGAKAIDRMLMIIFSEVHRGTLMFTHGTEERLNKDTSLESFRNHINTKMTFREALNKTCALLRKRVSHVELSHKRQKNRIIRIY